MAQEFVSKTQRKREMHELQELGAELVGLTMEQIDAMELPETLRNAVLEARRMSKFEAHRRQLQYIGKLMRSVDPEPIRAQLDRWKSASRAETARLHQIERWRDRLLADDDALSALLVEYPRADRQRMRTLVRSAREEQQRGEAPRSYRLLFQLLRELFSEPTKSDSQEDQEGKI